MDTEKCRLQKRNVEVHDSDGAGLFLPYFDDCGEFWLYSTLKWDELDTLSICRPQNRGASCPLTAQVEQPGNYILLRQ